MSSSIKEDHWSREKLSDFVQDLITGGRPKGGGRAEGYYISIGGTQINSEGYIEFKEVAYIPEDFFPKVEDTQLRKHDILIVKDGSNTGDVALVWQDHGNVVTNEHLFTLRVDEGLNSPYAHYFLQSHEGWKQLKGVITGSAQPGLNRGFVSKVDLPVPPLLEQRKIASILATVDTAIQKTEAIIKQAKQVKWGLMQDFFHGKHKQFDSYQSTPVGKIPDHWQATNIGSVVEMAQYGISESLAERGRYPIFRMNNIENGYMVDEPLKYIDLGDEEFEKYQVREGDILFNRTNSLELVGKTGIFELDGDYVFASYLVRLRANDRVEPRYLNYYMNSPEAQNRMMDFATKGVSQANINANSIQQVKLPLPPRDEQQEIASRLRSVDQEIEKNKSYASRLKRLKRGLMQNLLTGGIHTTGKDIAVLDEVAAHG